MKGLTRVGACVAIGVAAGAIAFALTPARYRAVTPLQVTITWHVPADGFPTFPPRDRFDEMLHNVFSEDWTESLMEELGLYREEREAGHFADALLRFRRNTAFSRRVESDISERWTVGFEADDPSVAEGVSFRLASFLAESVDDEDDDFDESFGLGLQILRDNLLEAESEISTWSAMHGSRTPPAAMTKRYQALVADYTDVLKETAGHRVTFSPHRVRPITLNIEIVKTPRVSDGRIGPSLLQFAGAGATTGLFIGLFTMPPFFWWRRHAP